MVKKLLFILFFQISIFQAASIQLESCGNEIATTYDEITKTLILSGKGEMIDFNRNDPPWFSFSNDIEKIQIGGEIISLGNRCFMGMTKLKSIEFQSNVLKRIGKGALFNSSLETITIPSSVEIIEENVFENNRQLKTIQFENGSKLKTIGKKVFKYCISLVSVSFPSSVENIGEHVLEGCKQLESVSFGEQLKTFSLSYFVNCPKLREININENNAMYSTIDNVVYSKDQQTLLFYPLGIKKSYLIINEKTKIIGRNAIQQSKLQSIVFPNSLESIEDGALSYNRYLEEIEIVSSQSKLSIGHFAFGGSHLTSIIYKSSSITLGQQSFYQCHRLQRVLLLSSLIQNEDTTFDSTVSLKEIHLLSNYQHNQQSISGKQLKNNVNEYLLQNDISYVVTSDGLLFIYDSGLITSTLSTEIQKEIKDYAYKQVRLKNNCVFD